MKKKLIVDILIFILMLLEFSRGYLSLILHELFGIILIILLVIHLILNKNYIKNIFKAKYNSKRIFMLIINILFMLFLGLSLIFGILSSEYILKFLNTKSMILIKLHKIFAYITLIILGLHIGMNFNSMFGKIEKRMNKILKYIINTIIIIYGIYSFIKLDIINHILGINDFSIFNANLILNIIRYLSIILTISLITNFIEKKNTSR